MKQRAANCLKKYAIVGAIGLLYAVFFKITGWGIPCVFRSITGFRCPGCGISHMCMELLHGRLQQAFQCNRGVFLLLPVLLFLWGRDLYRQIRTGTSKPTVTDHVLIVVCILAMIIWGVIRNLDRFQFLN